MCSAQFYLNYDHVFVRVHDRRYGSKSYKLKLLRKLVIKHGIRALFGGEVMCSNLTIVNLLIKPNKADCGCLIVNPNPINLTEYWFPHIFNSTLKKKKFTFPLVLDQIKTSTSSESFIFPSAIPHLYLLNSTINQASAVHQTVTSEIVSNIPL